MSSDGSPDPADRTLRLFVALELPKWARTAVGAWAAAELGAIDSLRPVRVEGLHVTLCFLGSTAVDRARFDQRLLSRGVCRARPVAPVIRRAAGVAATATAGDRCACRRRGSRATGAPATGPGRRAGRRRLVSTGSPAVSGACDGCAGQVRRPAGRAGAGGAGQAAIDDIHRRRRDVVRISHPARWLGLSAASPDRARGVIRSVTTYLIGGEVAYGWTDPPSTRPGHGESVTAAVFRSTAPAPDRSRRW